MPRLEDLRLNIDMLQTTLAVGFEPEEPLIGTTVLPAFVHPTMSVMAPIYGNEAFQISGVDDLRGLRSNPKTVDFDISYQSTELEEHALASGLDRLEEEAGSNIGINLISQSRQVAQGMVALIREKAIADLLFTAGTYASGNTTTISTKWDQATGDPFGDIETAKQAFRLQNGVFPNQIVFGNVAWENAKANAYVLAKMPGGTGADSQIKNVTEAQFASYIRIPRMYVGRSMYATDSTTFADIWGDHVSLSYVNPNPNGQKKPSFGYTLTRSFGSIENNIQLLGLSGYTLTDEQWYKEIWYMEQYKPWIARDAAGWLLSTTST